MCRRPSTTRDHVSHTLKAAFGHSRAYERLDEPQRLLHRRCVLKPKRLEKKLQLYGFNNLTKTLSFNFYDMCYATSERHRDEYIEYIDEAYNGERLTQILSEVAHIVGATVLNIATQDYHPRGASVTMLIAEHEPVPEQPLDEAPEAPTGDAILEPSPEAVVAHLDKSHITVHTYPESHPDKGVMTFRADIDVSTCGRVSPLKALNHLVQCFDEDIVVIDYRVRGFTRDLRGKKHFIDHKINSIQNFLAKETKRRYQMIDVNVYQEKIFHTKMILKDFDLNHYLFGLGKDGFSKKEQKTIERRIRREMADLFYGRNLPRT
jgi:S-adenosylmethionine decarboxylase